MVLPGTGTVDLPAARAGPRIMGLHHPDTPENMRFFTPPRRPEESLLWSRDIRFVNRLAQLMPSGRLLELDSGTCLIAPANELTEARAVEIARDARAPEYGLVQVDTSIVESDRYLVALASAVQQSGIAERVGMGQSVEVANRKMLDLFFHLHHSVVFQPIVDLQSGQVHEWECLFRPDMPRLPGSIAQLVEMAISTNRAVELDEFIVARILDRISAIDEARPAPADRRRRYAINFTPASLLNPNFSVAAFAAGVAAHGLSRRQITVECTEQMNIPDTSGLREAREGDAQARLRVRGGRRRCRLRELHAHRRPPAVDHQDRPRDHPGHRRQARRRQAGARRGVRLVRAADRRRARRGGHRNAPRAHHACGAWESRTARATCSASRAPNRRPRAHWPASCRVARWPATPTRTTSRRSGPASAAGSPRRARAPDGLGSRAKAPR